MRSIKKLISIALVGVLGFSTLVGCGNKSENAVKNGQEELVLWMPPIGDNDGPLWESILEKFEEENNVQVKVDIIPWENYPEKYATAISAGKGPDVGYMYAEMFPQFIEIGAIENLESYYTTEDYENHIYLNNAKMMGGVYGLPIEAANPIILYYNKDILDSLGEQPPVTWEDFQRICKKATKDLDGNGTIDQWGFSQGWGEKFFGDLNRNWYGFLWQAGGEMFNEDLKSVRFNDEAGLKAAQFLYDLNLVDKVVPEDSLAFNNKEMFENVFAKGKAAFAMHLSSLSTTMLDTDYPDLNYGFITSLKDETQATFASVDQLTLMSAAKNKELAFKLMEYMLSVEAMTQFHKVNPRAPMTKDEPYQGDPKFEQMVKEDKDIYRPLMVAPHGVEIYEYLWKELQSMIAGQRTPKEALDNAAKYANDLLKK